jgi:hypothetical protein
MVSPSILGDVDQINSSQTRAFLDVCSQIVESKGVRDEVKKTRAGRIVLALTNIVFLAILATAVYSAVPPAYNVGISSFTVTPGSPVYVVSVSYTVSNNGFYEIDNFYVSISVNDQSGNFVNETSSLPTSVHLGSLVSGTINLNIAQAYIIAHPGDYSIVLKIHSEFAFGLMKFSRELPNVQTLP